jgi:hypothetical protein
MQGVYTVASKIAGVTAAKTLFFLTAAATSVVEIISVSVTNANNETNEQLEIKCAEITTLGTPTATTVTPHPTEKGSAAAEATTKVNVTASEPTYASVPDNHQGVASLGGYFYTPNPEDRPVVSPSGSWGVKLENAPASLDLVVSVSFREIGGA